MRKRMVVSLLGFPFVMRRNRACAGKRQKMMCSPVIPTRIRDNPGPTSGDSFSLNGGNASVTYHIKDWIGGVADFGGYHTQQEVFWAPERTEQLSTCSTPIPRVSYRSYHRHFTPLRSPFRCGACGS